MTAYSLFVCVGIFTIAEEAESPAALSPPPTDLPDDSLDIAPATNEEGTVTALGEALESGLNLGAVEGEEDVVSPSFSELAPLEQLLRLCGQEVRALCFSLNVFSWRDHSLYIYGKSIH